MPITNIDLGRLGVERLIVHEVPARPVRGNGARPLLSEIESPLDQELKNYFKERITESLSTAAYEVILDPTSGSPVPRLIRSYLHKDQPPFVQLSVDVANHLYASQTGVNPPGLITVADLTLAGHRALGILKLEREQGVRLQQAQVENKRTFSIEHLRDLMLTEKTRVFKIGLFHKRGDYSDDIEGFVSDKQRGYFPITEVADFFLKKFLGCSLKAAPDVTTKQFFLATEDFINEKVDDPVFRAKYQMALLAELNANRSTIRPRVFAQDHLRTEHRQSYVEFLGNKGVSPSPIPKDISLVESQLHRVQLDFESGLAILGSPSTFDKHVKMKNADGGKTRVVVVDRLKHVRGKR